MITHLDYKGIKVEQGTLLPQMAREWPGHLYHLTLYHNITEKTVIIELIPVLYSKNGMHIIHNGQGNVLFALETVCLWE